MRLDEFDYELPPDRIAQRPAPRRNGSRLLLLERESGVTEHRRFSDLPSMLRAGDLLVLNDTRVLPARLIGAKSSGGRIELLLLAPVSTETSREVWRCWLKASRKPVAGAEIRFAGHLTGHVLSREGKDWTVEFRAEGRPFRAALAEVGRMPLPPYIRRSDDQPAPVDDRSRYQTVYARHEGAVAAPTAGLHFTRETLVEIAARGVETAFITLHVGAGTFEPVEVDRVDEHRMHSERYEIGESTAMAVRRARERGGRVVAVGTTVVRTLEWCAGERGTVRAGRGDCDLFIRPGYRFQVVDAMLTNFHLPRSTLVMLVSAFAGRSALLDAYREAVAREYRFYSYGDAMFIR